MALRQRLIGLGLGFFGATGAHRLAAPFTRGPGAILMLHRVADVAPALPGYAPNAGLTVAPAFLEAVLTRLRELGFDIVTLDEAAARLAGSRLDQPFVALTFDDGYRDTLQIAAPILRRCAAPYTVYVTPGFADRAARLWWCELEDAIAALDRVDIEIAGERLRLPARDAREKSAAFETVYWRLRARPEPELLDAVAALAQAAGVDPARYPRELCMDWDELATLAADPLCAIGAHTMTHPRLATLSVEAARREMAESADALAGRLGRPVRHFAYPVGDPTSAGEREFALARDIGFATAVTTRPGMLFPDHARRMSALPRVSVSGAWQSIACLDILLSGAPFAIWNRGLRVAA
ncbi:MAG: polysaccharide deacetylase family protein [Methylobacteriaceae bacterium]|nr:polysaccharide deacetylase family protein [Methylobacteriaceae bacterium]